jgi:hypothetical protein
MILRECERVAADRCDCYWLCVVTDCDNEPRLHVNKDPANLPWHEVKKADHYWLSVPACRDADGGAGRDGVREPMRVCEEPASYSQEL